MKNNTLIYIFIIALFGGSFFFSSCDDDTKEAIIGLMKADISGTAWQATGAGAVSVSVSETISGIAITGASLDKKFIELTVHGDSVGIYQLTIGKMQASALYYASQGDESTKFISTNATIEITSKTESRISGTFSFTAMKNLTDSLTVTNGTFSNILIN